MTHSIKLPHVNGTRAAFAGGAALLPVLLFTGCLETSTAPTDSEIEQADSAAAVGTDQFTDAVEQMTGSQFRFGEDDPTLLRDANETFNAALQLDPDNNQALLGAAVTGVLLAVQAHPIGPFISGGVGAESPLDPALAYKAPLNRFTMLGKTAADTPAVSLRPRSGSRPGEFTSITGTSNHETEAETDRAIDYDAFLEFRDALADSLLPALDDAITKLDRVHGDETFVLPFTRDGDEREIGHAEVSVLLAGFLAMHGLVTLSVAYDLELADNGSYEYLRVLDTLERIQDFTALSPGEVEAFNTLAERLSVGSPFLAVRSGWRTRLGRVDNNLREALDVLRSGLEFVQADTGQSLRILRPCSATGEIQYDCIYPGDLDVALGIVDTADKYMREPYPVPLADTTVHVNLAAYFDVQDYKELFPYYAFYDAGEWSEDKPVIYLSTPEGTETGNLNTLGDLYQRAYDEEWPAAELIDSLKPIVHWQDPTFQGFLPETTEERLWRLIQIAAEAEEDNGPGGGTDEEFHSSGTGIFKSAAAGSGASGSRVLSLSAFFDPRFPLLLIRN